MSINFFTFNILVFAVTISSLVGPSYAQGNGPSQGPRVDRDNPLVVTPQQHAFCDDIGRKLGVSRYAGAHPNYAELENEIMASRYGAILGRNKILEMLDNMNRAMNRNDVVGSLFRVNSACQLAIHAAGPPVMREMGANRGGIRSRGLPQVASAMLRKVNDAVIKKCEDVDLSTSDCDTDQMNQDPVSSLANQVSILSNIASGQAPATSVTANDKAPSVCDCASFIVRASPEKRSQVNATRAQLTGLIQDALNKKFINNYAQNREDLQFLTAHRGSVFGSSESEKNRNAESLICNQSAEFQSYISSRCRSVSSEELSRRQQDLFKNLEPLGAPSGSSIENHFEDLENHIRKMPFPNGASVASGHTHFERSVFDRIRNGMSYDQPVVSTLGSFLTNLIASEDFKKFTVPGKVLRPYDRIRVYLDTLTTRPDAENIKNKLVRNTNVNFSESFIQDAVVSFDEMMGDATGIHPGLRIALSEVKVFEKLVSKGGDVLRSIDTDKSILFDEHLKDSCNRIKNDYANALCNDQSKLISRVSHSQMDNLLAEQNLGISVDVAKYVMCSTEKDKQNELDLSISEPKSSLLSRISGERDFMGEIMQKFVNNDENVLNYIQRVTSAPVPSSNPVSSMLVREQNGFSPSSSSSPSILDYISEDGRVSSTIQSNNSSRVSQTTAATQGSTSEVASSSSTSVRTETAEVIAPKPEQSVFIPTSTYSNSSSVSNERSPASVNEVSRTQLKDSISTPENRVVVNDLVSKVDDDQIQELTRLRDEAKRTAELAQELTSKSQQDRIRALEDQIKGIETQRQSAIAETPTPLPTSAQRALVPPTEFSVARSVSEIPGREMASVAQAQVGGANGGGSVLGNLQSTLSSAINGNNPNSSSDVSPLVITSNVVKATSPDLSQEVLRFLETEPDLSSLTQIKESGLLYRFKVVRNGKETIEEVLIQFDRLSQEAKTALESKIAKRRNTNPSIERLENDLANVKRTHSYESLRMIIGQQASSRL